MIEIVASLKDTPVPSLLVIGGFILLLLAFAGRLAGQIDLPASRQRSAGVVGALLMFLGIVLYSLPNVPRSSLPATEATATAPTSQADTEQTTARPADTISKTGSTSEPTPTETATARATHTPLPEGFNRLEETIYGRFDPNLPGNVQLDEGRFYRFANERVGRYCRTEFPPDGLIWVLCIKVGEPEPTNIPASQPSRPTRPAATPMPAIGPTQTSATAPPLTATPPSSVTYRVDVIKTSLEAMKTLPGCENPAMGGDGKLNNACIVGPGGLSMEMHNLEFGRIYRFPSDVRQLYIGVSLRSTRIIVAADNSGLPVITIGNNEFFAELDQYYRVVVRKVE